MRMKKSLLYLLCGLCSLQVYADVPPRDRLLGKQGEAWVSQGNDPEKYDYSAFKEVAGLDGNKGLQSGTKVRRVGSQATAPMRAKGSPKVPVVLVQFSDLAFSVDSTAAGVNNYYYKFCNGNMDGTLYGGDKGYGSVRDYFVQQSDSLFLPEFVIIGPVILPENYAYYGKNENGKKDVNITDFFKQSVAEAQKLEDNWNQFDNDNDGVVDMAYFIYAGEGENAQTDPNTIWPKEMSTTSSIGGVNLSCYAACNELYGGDPDGIGVMCHEFSHALGLPDLYDTEGDNYGLDYWDLMDAGCYCRNGYWPCGYSSYEKDFMGWKELVNLEYNKECDLELLPLSEGGCGYKIVNPENEKECYVLENRQNTGWDTYIGRGTKSFKSHGMLVMHVDYIYNRWSSNSVNTSYVHPGVSIVPADNELLSLYAIADDEYARWKQSTQGDPFPGFTGRTSLLSNEQPVYTDSKYLHQPLTNIVEHDDGKVTLTVCRFADADANGTVDTQDVLSVYNCISTSDAYSPFMPEDMNTDGVVDTQDALGIYDYIQQR